MLTHTSTAWRSDGVRWSSSWLVSHQRQLCIQTYSHIRSSLCNWIKTTSSFCCQSSAGCAVISTEFLRTSGLLCCWSDDVELPTETICVILFTPPPSLVVYWRHFFSQSTSVYSALEADFSALMRYIKSRFTYLHRGCYNKTLNHKVANASSVYTHTGCYNKTQPQSFH